MPTSAELSERICVSDSCEFSPWLTISVNQEKAVWHMKPMIDVGGSGNGQEMMTD